MIAGRVRTFSISFAGHRRSLPEYPAAFVSRTPPRVPGGLGIPATRRFRLFGRSPDAERDPRDKSAPGRTHTRDYTTTPRVSRTSFGFVSGTPQWRVAFRTCAPVAAPYISYICRRSRARVCVCRYRIPRLLRQIYRYTYTAYLRGTTIHFLCIHTHTRIHIYAH